MNWLKLIKNHVIPVWIALGTIALGFIMAYRPWGMKVGFIIIGLLLILKGIYTKAKNKEDLALATPLGDSPLGCVIGLIVALLFAGFLRLMPTWIVRSLWFLLGIGLIMLGLKFNF